MITPRRHEESELATLEDAAHLVGRAEGMMLAHGALRLAGHEELALKAADLAKEALLMAARIRRQADDAILLRGVARVGLGSAAVFQV